jgi:hypothetical protein
VQVTASTGTQAPFWHEVPAPQAGEQGVGMHESVAAEQVVPVPHCPTQAGVPLVSQVAQPG